MPDYFPPPISSGGGSGTVTLPIAESDVTSLVSDLALKAPLASPTLTGTPSLPTGTTASTQSAADSSTKLATTAFATTADNLKANLASPTFTGTVVLPSSTVTSGMIVDATIVDGDVNASAAIAGSKISGTAFAPQLTNLVCPYPPYMIASGNITGANSMVACRVVVPKSGTLTDLTVYINTTSGNVDLGVYDCGDSVAGSYSRLYNTGSVACSGNTTWQTVSGSTGVSVVQGQHIVLAYAADNGTTAVGRCTANLTTSSQLPTGFIPCTGGATPKLFWTKTASFTLPSAVTEANATQLATCPCIIARIV